MAGAIVLIGCKAPNGLVLNLDRYETTNDNRPPRRISGGQPVTLKGWSVPFGVADTTSGGYALTEVPADFWEAWLKANADSSLLADKVILPPHRDASAQANAHAAVPALFPRKDGFADRALEKLTAA